MASRNEALILPLAREQHSTVADDFSLMRGGLFYRLQQRLGFADEDRIRVVQRALLAVLVTWLPLLVLSVAQGLAIGEQVHVPFFRDFVVNARFLFALPVLVVAETTIDRRLRIMVVHFLKSGLVKGSELPAFEALIGKVTRLRDHRFPEIVILAVAYLPSLISPRSELIARDVSSWHLSPAASGEMLSYAGWWFALVSIPLIRFLLLRWLWRILLWSSFLWRVSKFNLLLTPIHPDRAGGIGFLSGGQEVFGLIALAGGAVIAGQVGNAIAYEGAKLAELKFVMAGYCVFVIILLLAPLLLLIPTLYRVKKRGLLEYGALATGYTQMFDGKWVHGKPPQGETLLGSSDIQALADLGTSFAIVQEMRLAPIDKGTFFELTAAAILPMVPVLIFATPAEDLVQAIVKLLA